MRADEIKMPRRDGGIAFDLRYHFNSSKIELEALNYDIIEDALPCIITFMPKIPLLLRRETFEAVDAELLRKVIIHDAIEKVQAGLDHLRAEIKKDGYAGIDLKDIIFGNGGKIKK